VPTPPIIGTLKMLESEYLTIEEIENCKRKNKPQNQLVFGIMFAYFKIHLKFPTKQTEIKPEIILWIADELTVETMPFHDFNWINRTTERYRTEIRSFLGFREAKDKDSPALIDHLIKSVLPNEPSEQVLHEQIRLYFYTNKIECFTSDQLERYISSAKAKFEQQLFQKIFDNLSDANLLMIDQILTEHNSNKKFDIIVLSELKKDIPGARPKNVDNAIAKIRQLSSFSIPEEIEESVNRKVLLKYYNRIMALHPSNILEFSPLSKYAAMAIFCHIRLQIMLDSLCITLIRLLRRMRNNAESYVDNNILKDVKRVGGKIDILEKLAKANFNYPKEIIEDKVYPEVSRDKLKDLINDLNHRSKWYDVQVNKKLHTTYANGNRTVLIEILNTLDLREENTAYAPIVRAIKFIKKYWDDSKTEYYTHKPPLKDIIPDNWSSMVVIDDNDDIKVNKYNYELAVFEQLKDIIDFKGIWVDKSYQYRNPQRDIPKDFDDKKEEYCNMLGVPYAADDFIKDLKKTQRKGLAKFNKNISANKLVKIKKGKKKTTISVSPSEKQKEPENIILLQKEIIKRYSSINLIDILKECDLLINFTGQMKTVSRAGSIEESDLRIRLLLCLFAIGSNTGLKRISIANGNVKYDDLLYVKRRYINEYNIRSTIKKVINRVLKIRDPAIWGEATTTVVCDSTELRAWNQNLLNEWHPRYKKNGVMIYWHVDKKSLVIYSQLKTCLSSEVGSMIKGVIDHDTKMNMNRIFVDSHGQSVLGFAVSHFQAFALLPRLKAIDKQKLCGITPKDKKKYSNISAIMRGTVKWSLIKENYDDMLKYMAALKLGTIEPEVLVRRFGRKNYEHPLYKAFTEVGKAVKTSFLCDYLAEEELRIEVNEGLNVVERLNNFMDFIFYGKLGELKTNQTEDQKLAVLCLHLLQACMVYVNTLIIQEILSEPEWKNRLTPEDYRALTPLFAAHINPYGLFPVDLAKRIFLYTNVMKGTTYAV
jgi:TnpA family transposase